MTPDNPYRRWIGDDMALCKPLITGDELREIPLEVAARVFHLEGKGPKARVFTDLEHLQVVDYGAFDGLSAGQRQQIADLHAGDPIRPEDMVFLALKSLFQFVWPKPTSEDDIRYAAYTQSMLNMVLKHKALDLAKPFAMPDGLLPYWGRMAFLRVLGNLPYENVQRFGLDRVACTLVKRAKFNATTIAHSGGPIIAINYALEPVLKQLNGILLHFFGTREMAGPKRLDRALNSLLPMVLHFWSDISAIHLVREPTALYDDTGTLGHELTYDQTDFIVMHELGHVALDHPRRLKAEVEAGRNVTMTRHEFEFSADAFALGLMRSSLMNATKAALQGDQRLASGDAVNALTGALHDHQRQLGSVFLLFTYMDFIQRAGEMLRDRNNGALVIAPSIDSHPRAAARLGRLELMNLGEYLYTSPLQRYAAEFLQSVLDYASGLEVLDLIERAAAVAK